MKQGSTETSRKLFGEAKKYMVGGVASSLHKSEFEEYPLYADHGSGSRVYDVDGNEYIDYMGSFGPSILGFNNPALVAAVTAQAGRGAHFAMPTRSLNELSERLTGILPCAERVGYQSTGTEANLVNFRLARAFTGKRKILKFEGHYHGWADELMVAVRPPSLKCMGPRNSPWKVPESPGQLPESQNDIIVAPWNDLDLVERIFRLHGNDIAAVITEPVMYNAEPIMPLPGFLAGLRELTKRYDILFIIDEVITGFRIALGGAQEYFGVVPDLCTFGKAMAGGYPIAGVAGRKEILEAGFHPAGTFNANPLCVAASLATLDELSKPGTYDELRRITHRITSGVVEIAQRLGVKLFCDGLPGVWQIQFGIDSPMRDFRDNFKVDKASYQEFYRACLTRGLKLHPSRGRFYVSTSHTDADVDETLEIVEDALRAVSARGSSGAGK